MSNLTPLCKHVVEPERCGDCHDERRDERKAFLERVIMDAWRFGPQPPTPESFAEAILAAENIA